MNERAAQPRRRRGERAKAVEKGEEEADHRAAESDLELGAGGIRLAGDLGDAADKEKGDAGNGDAAALADDAVPELVQEDAEEEDEGGQAAQGEVNGNGAAREGGGKSPGGEFVSDEGGDEEPAIVEIEPDTEEAAEIEAEAGTAGHLSERGTTGMPMRGSLSKRARAAAAREPSSMPKGSSKSGFCRAGFSSVAVISSLQVKCLSGRAPKR